MQSSYKSLQFCQQTLGSLRTRLARSIVPRAETTDLVFAEVEQVPHSLDLSLQMGDQKGLELEQVVLV